MFAEAALAAWRAAVIALGWRPAEFWDATPQELLTALAAVLDDDREPRPLSRAELDRLLGEVGHGG